MSSSRIIYLFKIFIYLIFKIIISCWLSSSNIPIYSCILSLHFSLSV
nr:MAG TPA: hypothetical protein [Caudoviricetes sp.]DAX04670.1 MAG TPA: hypothetical protein [Bacteriophage sp.]